MTNRRYDVAALRDGKTAMVECPVCMTVTGYHHDPNVENLCACCNAPIIIQGGVRAMVAVRTAKTTWSDARVADCHFTAYVAKLTHDNTETPDQGMSRVRAHVETAMRVAGELIGSTAVDGLEVVMVPVERCNGVFSRAGLEDMRVLPIEHVAGGPLTPGMMIVLVRDEGGRHYTPGCMGLLLTGRRAKSGEA